MIPKRVRLLVAERSGGICEGCGQAPATEMHHRQYKSRGGKDTPDNLLHLCGWGNHTGCHGKAHQGGGEARGWSVHSWDKPLNVPFQDGSGTWWFLLADGTRLKCGDPVF